MQSGSSSHIFLKWSDFYLLGAGQMRGRGGPGRIGLRRGMRLRGGVPGRGALGGRGAARGAPGGRGEKY